MFLLPFCYLSSGCFVVILCFVFPLSLLDCFCSLPIRFQGIFLYSLGCRTACLKSFSMWVVPHRVIFLMCLWGEVNSYSASFCSLNQSPKHNRIILPASSPIISHLPSFFFGLFTNLEVRRNLRDEIFLCFTHCWNWGPERGAVGSRSPCQSEVGSWQPRKSQPKP